MKLSQQKLDGLAVSAGIGVAGRFAGRFLIVLENLLFARMLGPAIFGLYALGSTVFRLIELIASLGFDIGVIRYGAVHLTKGNHQAVKGMILWSLFVSFCFSVLISILLFWFSPWIAAEIFNQQSLTIVFRLFAPIIPLSALLAILAAIIRLRDKMKYSVAVQDLGQPMIALVVLLVFWISGLNLERAIIADQLSYFLAVLLAVYFSNVVLTDVFKKEDDVPIPSKEYYSFSLTSAASIFLSTLVLWVDRIFAGIYLSPSDVGIYQAALQISVIFAVFLGALSRMSLPMFSTLYSEGSIDELEEVFRIGTKWTFYVSLPIVLFISLNTDIILNILYGEVYSIGGEILMVLLVGQLINLVTGSVGPLLLVGGYQRILFFLFSAMIIVNASLCVILIPNFGLLGAALANTISIGIMYSIALFVVRMKMKLWPYDFHYLKGVISIVIAGVAGWSMKYLLLDSSPVCLAIQFLVIVGAFTIALFMSGLSNEDQVFVTIVLRRLGIETEFFRKDAGDAQD